MTLTEQEKRARRLKTNLFLWHSDTCCLLSLHYISVMLFINIEIVDLESINKATENAFQHMQNKPIFIPTKQSLKHLLFFSVFYFVMVAYYLTTRKNSWQVKSMVLHNGLVRMRLNN